MQRARTFVLAATRSCCAASSAASAPGPPSPLPAREYFRPAPRAAASVRAALHGAGAPELFTAPCAAAALGAIAEAAWQCAEAAAAGCSPTVAPAAMGECIPDPAAVAGAAAAAAWRKVLARELTAAAGCARAGVCDRGALGRALAASARALACAADGDAGGVAPLRAAVEASLRGAAPVDVAAVLAHGWPAHARAALPVVEVVANVVRGAARRRGGSGAPPSPNDAWGLATLVMRLGEAGALDDSVADAFVAATAGALARRGGGGRYSGAACYTPGADASAATLSRAVLRSGALSRRALARWTPAQLTVCFGMIARAGVPAAGETAAFGDALAAALAAPLAGGDDPAAAGAARRRSTLLARGLHTCALQGVRAPALAAAAAAHFASPHAAPLLGRSPYNVRLLELLAFVDAAARVRGDVPLLGPELAAAAAAAAAAVAARPRALSLAQTELVAAVAAALPPGVSHAVAVSPLPGIQVLVHLAGAGGAVDMDGPSRFISDALGGPSADLRVGVTSKRQLLAGAGVRVAAVHWQAWDASDGDEAARGAIVRDAVALALGAR